METPAQEAKIIEKRKNSQPFSVLFTGIIMTDGYGDEEHLENMSRAFKNFLIQLNYSHIKPVILLGCFEDKKTKLIAIMRKDGLLSQNTLETDDCFQIQKKNPSVFLMSF